MPYRAELKRPDLKGNFPCTVCGKVFCHSSSLSRHRMQAHFKSYTCTLCNQEISSNETLRSHMFRSHEISRMFMCRCCNWAFPDKTSLHIHMQSMMRHGQPGDVNILAKSSTEGGPSPLPVNALATATMEREGGGRGPPHGVVPPGGLGDLFGSPKQPASSSIPLAPNSSAGSIFPSMGPRDDLLARMRGSPAQAPQQPQPQGLQGLFGGMGGNPAQLQAALQALQASSGSGQGNLLQSWLANNFSSLMGGAPASPTRVAASLGCGLDSTASLNLANESGLSGRPVDESSVFSDDGLEIHMGPDEEGDEIDCKDAAVPSPGDRMDMQLKGEPAEEAEAKPPVPAAANPLNSLLYKKKLTGQLRGGSGIGGKRGASLADFLATRGNGGVASPGAGLFGGKEEAAAGETQPSPAASDSQTSSSGAGASDSATTSPLKCYECQVTKGKLSVSENRNRFLESKVGTLESKIGRLERRVAGYEANALRYDGEQRQLRSQCEVLERKLLACQEKALRYLQDSNNNGAQGNALLMKDLLEDLLQTPELTQAPPVQGPPNGQMPQGFNNPASDSPLAKKPRICV